MSDRPLRVIHLPTSVGGNPQSLARAERALGLDSVAVAFEQNWLRYEGDEVLYRPGDGRLRKELRRFGLLARALRDFDVVHLNFGRSALPVLDRPPPGPGAPLGARLRDASARACCRLLELADVPLLRAAGKAVFVTFQGDDARQGDARPDLAGELEPGYYTPASDAAKRRRIARLDRWADRIYALNPDLLRVLPARARFLPYANIDFRRWSPPAAPREPGPPRVLHAPTHRGIKGTRHLLEAVRRLRAEGLELELLLVEGLSHAEARRLYERADLVVDQLLLGWYGGLAVEAMALGKPVVCYLREDDLGALPAGMRHDLPLIQASPATLPGVLREWLTAPAVRLAERGRAGRSFVERWHDPLRIAGELADEYRSALAARGRQRPSSWS